MHQFWSPLRITELASASFSRIDHTSVGCCFSRNSAHQTKNCTDCTEQSYQTSV